MNCSRTLALCAFFATATAWAREKDQDLGTIHDPCIEKGNDAQDQCAKECFKVDPNQKDQKPEKKEMKCMQGCAKKSADAMKKCRDAEAAKKAGPQKKVRDE